jgi:hypothetical protein
VLTELLLTGEYYIRNHGMQMRSTSAVQDLDVLPLDALEHALRELLVFLEEREEDAEH